MSNEPQAPDLPEQMRVRREKRAEVLASGHEAYPVAVDRTHTLAEVRAAHPDLPPDTATGDIVGVTGRVIFLRNTGKLCFATLREGDGTRAAGDAVAGVGRRGGAGALEGRASTSATTSSSTAR